MGGRRNDTCDHGLSRSWKVEVCGEKKKKKITVSNTNCRGESYVEPSVDQESAMSSLRALSHTESFSAARQVGLFFPTGYLLKHPTTG